MLKFLFRVLSMLCCKHKVRWAILTSSSSGILDSLRAVGKARGVNVTRMCPTGLGAGRSAILFFLSLSPLRSKHRKWPHQCNKTNYPNQGSKKYDHSGNYLNLQNLNVPPFQYPFSCFSFEVFSLFLFLLWPVSSASFLCFICHISSSAVVFSRSVSFIFCILSRSSFSSFQYQTTHVIYRLNLISNFYLDVIFGFGI